MPAAFPNPPFSPRGESEGGYPAGQRERDDWILARRLARNAVDPMRANAFWLEEERTESGSLANTATLLLANRECPWRCLMCDLWKHTLTSSVPAGAIVSQIEAALSELAKQSGGPLSAAQIKLYNSGSFFDPRAIPPEDHPGIAELVRGFERVIVECHPSLVNERCLRFRDLISPARLEVAMGLETACPEVLDALNKRMTLGDFARAAEFLRRNDIALRVFVLIKPPFMDEERALHWAKRSIDFAMDCGAAVVSLIPTRHGNGALEALAERGEFSPPRLATVEAALDYGVNQRRGRVFVDLWDIHRFTSCSRCASARIERLNRINREQVLLPSVMCDCV